MKGANRLLLVTDSNRAIDLPPGRYRFGSAVDGSWFESDGKVGWAPDGGLASSIMGMDHMVRQMLKATTATLPEAIRMGSLTPAERTGIAHRFGKPRERQTRRHPRAQFTSRGYACLYRWSGAPSSLIIVVSRVTRSDSANDVNRAIRAKDPKETLKRSSATRRLENRGKPSSKDRANLVADYPIPIPH